MAAIHIDLSSIGDSRSAKSNCLLLGIMALFSAIALPICFVLVRLAMLVMTPAADVDSIYSPFASVGFYIWLTATPLIAITALLAGRFELRRESSGHSFTDVGIIISVLSLVMWTMPASMIFLSMILGGGR